MRPAAITRSAGFWLPALLVLATANASRGDPIQTYVALGDALAFGQSTSTPQPSFGDQGYVQQFATYLGTKNNGIAPNVINLAVSGETSSSYFTADNSAGISRQAGAGANLNYGGDTSLAQRNILAGVLAAEHAAGRVITTVSFALGLGDYLSLTNSSGFSQLTLAQQQSSVQQMLTTLKANYITALTQIRGSLPSAQLFLLNYYNPFSSLGPTNPQNQLFTTFVTGQDQLVHSLAPQFNANIVDVASAFANSSSGGLTIGSSPGSAGFPYPTPTGFNLIASQLVSVAEAPEPSTLMLLCFGAVGAASSGWWRRRVS